MSNLLPTITGPADLKKLTIKELTALAAEIRSFLLEHVSQTGGHLAPNLGVVELTLAIHTVFNSPTDEIVWMSPKLCPQNFNRSCGTFSLKTVWRLMVSQIQESEHDILEWPALLPFGSFRFG